jgi:hypothetical protein
VAWIPVLAAGCAIVTTVTYVATTPAAERNVGDALLAAGAGALGGALIGTGVGAGAGVAIIAAGAGAGAFVSAESYMVSNALTGESFDSTDFAVTTGFGMAEGAAAAIPGVGPLGSTAVSAVAAGGQSIVTDLVHDRPVDWEKAGTETAWGGLAGLAGEVVSGGFAPASGGVDLGEGIKVINWIPPQSISNRIIAQTQREAAREAVRTTVRDTSYSILTNIVEDYLLD